MFLAYEMNRSKKLVMETAHLAQGLVLWPVRLLALPRTVGDEKAACVENWSFMIKSWLNKIFWVENCIYGHNSWLNIRRPKSQAGLKPDNWQVQTWAGTVLPDIEADWAEAKKVPPLPLAASEQVLWPILAPHQETSSCSPTQAFPYPLIHVSRAE